MSEKEDEELWPLVICHHCNNQFRLHFKQPLAVECPSCGGLFDARLQFFRELKKVLKRRWQ